MAKRSWNALTLRAELDAIDTTLAPHLDKAKVLTASIDGKSVPISDAPIADRIKSLMAVNPVGEDNQKGADLSITNADIAARLEKAESDLSVANATTGGLHSKIRDLEARATTAESTVQKMTAERGQLDLELHSSRSEYARVGKEQAALNGEISRLCLGANCLTDLRDDKNNLLASTATAADRESAANRVAPADKLKAYAGALNSAVARTQVSLAALPAPGATAIAGAKTEVKGRARFSAAVAVKQ
jgi:hypothetical protein